MEYFQATEYIFNLSDFIGLRFELGDKKYRHFAKPSTLYAMARGRVFNAKSTVPVGRLFFTIQKFRLTKSASLF
jgi:hypothetical protein